MFVWLHEELIFLTGLIQYICVTECTHRTLPWRNCSYKYVKKPLSGSDSSPSCCHSFCRVQCEERTIKIQGTKKAMEGSGENRHYLENPVSSLTGQNSFSSSFSLFNSPVPFKHILTSSGKKQNNLKENGGKRSNIHHREATHIHAIRS